MKTALAYAKKLRKRQKQFSTECDKRLWVYDQEQWAAITKEEITAVELLDCADSCDIPRRAREMGLPSAEGRDTTLSSHNCPDNIMNSVKLEIGVKEFSYKWYREKDCTVRQWQHKESGEWFASLSVNRRGLAHGCAYMLINANKAILGETY